MAKFSIGNIEDETLYDVFNGVSANLQMLANGGVLCEVNA